MLDALVFVKLVKKKECRRKLWQLLQVMWIAVHLIALVALSFLTYDATMNYKNSPTATALETDAYPIKLVDFPAVVICNVNVISRSLAVKYAEELWESQAVRSVPNLTLSKIKDLLKYIGHIYTFATIEDSAGDIMLLDEILRRASNGSYSVFHLIKKIGVNCNSFLLRCGWEGVARTCEDILLPRRTPDGVCCTFNYARWSDGFASDVESNLPAVIERSKIRGSVYGLWLLLDTNADDYYYQVMPSQGFKVMICGATDYPDAPSGSLREILVMRGSETFLNLRAATFYSTPDVIHHSESKRHCLFKSELPKIFGGQYSFSDCIMECRVRDIVDKCSCVPFYYPIPSHIGKIKRCDLQDLKCLHHYKNRWWSLEPMFSEGEDLPSRSTFTEIPEGHLQCHCLPSCANTDYTVFKSSGQLTDRIITWDTSETALNTTKNHVVVNVFFGNSGVIRLKQDVTYYWYELMSNYGGFCSIFLGISVMSVIEFSYKSLCIVFGKKGRIKNVAIKKKTVTFRSNVVGKVYPVIYWEEVLMRRGGPV